MMMAVAEPETVSVRLRLVFEDRHMLSKSKKKEGLKRSWVLLKSQHKTISDLVSHLLHTFQLHRSCPDGIILSMDGFVLPPFESTSILKDKDIVCAKRKGLISTNNKAAMLSSPPHGHQSVQLPKLLVSEEFQEEFEGYKTMSQEDNSDQFEDAVFTECKLQGGAVSKKRKASKKLRSLRHKKIKLSSTEKLAVTHEGPVEENGSFQGNSVHQQLSLVKKDNNKSSNLSNQPDKPGTLDFDKQRLCQPQDDGGTKKLPSRSARRKKAKRRWLREQKKEKLQPSPVLEKDGLQSPINANHGLASDVHQQTDEESEAEDDVVPVEIRPGHIRFEPLRKDQAAPQNQLPMFQETFQWNGTTIKKKGQKWGTEKISSRKLDDFENSNQECHSVQNAEKKYTFNPHDFDKLIPYTSLPKEGDLIAYRLIELSSSWTPELSSFRVGKISQYDARANRIWVDPVSEYPFDLEKKIDKEASSVQSDPSPYGEDGSLEIDYSSLADVRMVKHGNSDSANVVACRDALINPTKATNGSPDEQLASDQTAVGSCKSQVENQGHIPSKENGEVNVWDEINEALTAKKVQLSRDDGWSKDGSGTRSWSHRALRCSALGPTIALLRSQNGL